MKLWKDGRQSRAGVHLKSRCGACSLPRKYDMFYCDSSFPCNLTFYVIVGLKSRALG